MKGSLEMTGREQLEMGSQRPVNIESDLLSQLQSHYQKVQSTNVLRLYWQDELGWDLSVLSLPFDKPRTAIQIHEKTKHEKAKYTFDLGEDLTYKLKALSPSDDINSFFITVLAAFKTLLYRLSGQKDIVVVTPTNMPFAPKEKRVSNYTISPLILRTTLSGNLTFSDCLGFVEQTVNESVLIQEYPYELILEKPGKTANPPIFQIMFAWVALPTKNKQWSESIGVERSTIDSLELEQFDLALIATETAGNLIISWQYNPELFSEPTIARLAGNFQTLIQGIVAEPELSISLLPILTDKERHQLLVEWNYNPAEYPQHKCIHQLFEEQVERTPNAIAVTFGDQQITYQDLNNRANQLGHYLRSLGIKPDAVVGICVERSIEMIVGLLGILKSGGAYAPLDPAYPSDRLAYMVEDSQLTVLVTQKSLLTTCADFITGSQARSPVIFSIDSDWEHVIQYSRKNPVNQTTPQNLAYVIYTSGSTGKPKGVLLNHRPLVNLLAWQLENSNVGFGGKTLQFSPVSFDVSFQEIFSTGLAGGTLVMITDETRKDAVSLLQFLNNHAIERLFLPFIALQHLTEIAETREQSTLALREVITAGEQLQITPAIINWFNRYPNCTLHNHYGPSESHVVTAYTLVGNPETWKPLPSIGRPLPHTELFILDNYLQPVPIGVIGELFISVADPVRGYINRPDLTSSRFISNPFSSDPNSRLYKTGDLARYLPDGNIECLGRIDNQVKIRGFRIEIGEIEALLSKHPLISEAIVVARKESNGNKRLVAYVVEKTDNTQLHPIPLVPQLRSFLKEQLADYMIPSSFVVMESLPITPSGKVNRLNLPAPSHDRPALGVDYVSPRDPIEAKLARIWSKILEVEPLGIYDNFFELGGNSILIAQILNQVREVLAVDIAMSYFFDNPTVSGLAETISLLHQPNLDGAVKKSIDLEAEVVLDSEISAFPELLQPPIIPINILLTGVTGYLGAFLLHELLHKTEASIYCLVRAANIKDSQHKIQKNLERYLLENKNFNSRIIPVLGDLAQPLLGLSAIEFNDLADKIDVIYHNGAYVNLVYPYSVLKATNVLGTQEVLRLASRTKLKPVHYVSTVSVFESDDYTGRQDIKEDEELPRGDSLSDGYAQSKWVAEKLVNIAYTRGIPFTMYRPGMIAGHSKTGASNITDINCRLIKAFVQLGTAPNIDLPINMTPADYVSGAMVHLSMQKSSIGKTFHLVNPQGIPINKLVSEMNMIGYAIDLIPFELWKQELIAKSSTDNSLSVLLPLLTENVPGTELTYLEVSSMQSFDCQNTLNGLANSAIACPPVDSQLLKTYFDYFNLCGFIN